MNILHAQKIETKQLQDSILQNFEDKLKIVKSDTAKLKVLLEISEFHTYRETEKSLKTLNQALELFNVIKEKKDSSYLGDIYRISGIANRRLGNIEKALVFNQKAYEIYVKLKDSLYMAHVNHNIAVMYRNFKEYKKSIFYGKKSITINKKIERNIGLGYNHNNIALSFLGLKKIDSTLYYLKKARSYFLMSNYKEGLNRVNMVHADILIREGKYTKGLTYYLESLKYRESQNYKQEITSLSVKLSRVYLKLKQYKTAEKYINKALHTAHQESYLRYIGSAYKVKAEILEATNRYKKAYKSITLYHKYKDSIINIDNVKKIQKIELTHGFRKEKIKDSIQLVKEREVAETKVELLKAENKIHKQRVVFGGLGLIIIFSLAYLIRYRKFTLEKQKLQAQFSKELINSQEEERSRLASELHDSVGQKLMLLSKQTKNQKEENLGILADSTLEEIRSISRGLYPATFERIGITASIQSMINEVDANTNLFFTTEIDNIDKLLPKENALHLYRIIQEILSNIIKHSKAKSVSISISKKENRIETIIEDNGEGFELSEKLNSNTSLGMKTLFERSRIIKSKLFFNNRANKGTVMQLVTPISYV
ncbi:ATP-binding protein [Tenacibaculum sp. 190524A02b]|uniref:tetratricopeptide repeat-containing sensor histidine kinase n=1 Tax=Tenacibaculum vairaonense TaxID=3137860 RepID=UPI0031FAE96D